MFLHVSVILFTGGRGVCQRDLQTETPWAETPSPGQRPASPGQRTPLETEPLPWTESPPPPRMVTRGRYASYWNAFLFYIKLQFLPAMNAQCITQCRYKSGTVNSKFHLIRSFCKIFARFLSFHV